MGGGGTTVQAPQPSAEEKALQAQQAEALKQQQGLLANNMRVQELMAPLIYKQAGIVPQYDAKGQISGFSEAPPSVQQQQQETQQQLTTELLQRSVAAAKGELPIDPNVTNSIKEQEQTLHSMLSNALGPGYATSTPGIEALTKFATAKTNALAAASRGDLTTATQLAGGQLGLGNDMTNQNLNRMLIPTSQGGNLATAFGSLAQGAGGAAGAFMNDRQMTLQALMANAQNKQSGMNALMGGVGGMAGMLGAAAIM